MTRCRRGTSRATELKEMPVDAKLLADSLDTRG